MNTRLICLSRPLGASLALAAALVVTLGSAPALAAGNARPPSPQAQYQRDIAACRTPERRSDREDCFSEASTALAGALPPSVDPDPGRYARNALKRCEPLAEPDRSDCVARIQGQGTTSGSVAAGGIYRELVTVTREAPLPEPITAITPVTPVTPVTAITTITTITTITPVTPDNAKQPK